MLIVSIMQCSCSCSALGDKYSGMQLFPNTFAFTCNQVSANVKLKFSSSCCQAYNFQHDSCGKLWKVLHKVRLLLTCITCHKNIIKLMGIETKVSKSFNVIMK